MWMKYVFINQKLKALKNRKNIFTVKEKKGKI